MKKSDFEFLSSNGKISLHGILWQPDTAPRAVVQVHHGMLEYAAMYGEFAAYCTDRGFAVLAYDQIGHGQSMDPDNPTPVYFGPEGSWRHLVNDAKACADLAHERFPGVPLCMLGLSLGSVIVRCIAADFPGLAQMIVPAATGSISGWQAKAVRMVCAREKRRYGDTVGTPLLRQITMGIYNRYFRPNRTEFDWLCANGEALDRYLVDPEVGRSFTVGAFRELVSGLDYCGRKETIRKMPKDVPVLLISGKDDAFGQFGKTVHAIARRMRNEGVRDVEMILRDGMRHNIFSEKEYPLVFRDIADWIDARLASSDGTIHPTKT